MARAGPQVQVDQTRTVDTLNLSRLRERSTVHVPGRNHMEAQPCQTPEASGKSLGTGCLRRAACRLLPSCSRGSV